MTNQNIKNQIEQHKVCIVIPTYNNERTLKQVIDGVLNYSNHVLVINDGSTDSTKSILSTYSNIHQIHLEKNQGKGNALRQGFKQAVLLGYRFVITIDSDGQHFPEDIPVFLEAFEAEKEDKLLLIGARNMTQDGVPKKSSFGNNFSNFWYWVETGIKLSDTQSGFRLYPVHSLKDLTFYTRKFEFEIEVIVRAAWNDVVVKNVPIQVHYDQEDRISHFRPFKDFTRISILNTCLVTITFLYIKPLNFLKSLKRKGFRRFLTEDFLHNHDSPRKKALSIALGIFIGLSPLWGFHTLLVIFLAMVLRLNKVIAFAFSNISIPPMIPFILYASTLMGNFVLGQQMEYSFSDFTQNFEFYKNLRTYIIGSFSLAIIAAVCFGILGYITFKIFNRIQPALKNG
ncbi:MAG: DUF2062 domain-containing protein [Mangrovimonas sp.]|nr:DUF2062 domain-containing protein [Mangrovimonas sp.]